MSKMDVDQRGQITLIFAPLDINDEGSLNQQKTAHHFRAHNVRYHYHYPRRAHFRSR